MAMEMNDGRQPFLDALAKDEDDVTTRLVYADWLDEHGFPEEANRQRQWNAAKAWLVAFGKSLRESPEPQWYSSSEEYEAALKYYVGEGLSYENLLEVGRDIVSEGHYSFGSDDSPIVFAVNTEEFLRNWSIVTGENLPDDFDPDSVTYSCSC